MFYFLLVVAVGKSTTKITKLLKDADIQLNTKAKMIIQRLLLVNLKWQR